MQITGIFCTSMAASYSLQSCSLPTTPFHKKSCDITVIYRLDTSTIERNSCSHVSCSFLKNLSQVVLSYRFPKMALFRVKQATARVLCHPIFWHHDTIQYSERLPGNIPFTSAWHNCRALKLAAFSHSDSWLPRSDTSSAKTKKVGNPMRECPFPPAHSPAGV